MSPRKPVVVGIGNRYRGDDAAGLEIARHVRGAGLGGVTVRECSGNLLDVLDSLHGSDMVVLADAVQSGSPPGTIFRFDALAEAIPGIFVRHLSSHGIGVAEFIELARALDRLPRNLIVYGVEGVLFDTGTTVSPEIEVAIEAAARRILVEILACQSVPTSFSD